MPSIKSKIALQFSVESMKSNLYMWTVTWKEPQSVREGSKKWGRFLSDRDGFCRAFPFVGGLRVYEMHPGRRICGEQLSHGLHVHALVNERLSVDVVRSIWQRKGGGRINVKFIPRERAMYVGKYLTKRRLECFKGVRLWAPFGACESSKVKDIVCETEWTRTYHLLSATIGNFKKLRWDQRARITSHVCLHGNLNKAFESIGFGPDFLSKEGFEGV